mmetsp:Transcript_25998/g.72815  ORF Transcript_25998/g.72815 Transcript_25998/m.72815 type:complete len:372 (+) Transcript_25998:62-1177(+)
MGKTGGTRVIPEEYLGNLIKWKHEGVADNWVDVTLMQPFWTFVASLVPRWIAPNMITFIGNIGNLLGAGLIFYFVPGLGQGQEAPSWLYYVLALLCFSWQTLDAIDGKHARAIGMSSPLGAVFDHGMDGFSWVQYFLISVTLSRVGFGWLMCLMVVYCSYMAFISYWSTKYTGVMYWSTTESQFIVMGGLLASGTFGSAWVWWTVPYLQIHLGDLLMVLGLFGPTKNALFQCYTVFSLKEHRVHGELRELLYASVTYLSFGVISMQPAFHDHATFILFFFTFNIASSHHCNKTIVYDCAAMDSDPFEWTTVLTAATAGAVVLLPDYAIHAVAGTLVILSVIWVSFWWRAIHEISAHLHIPIMTVRKAPRNQ